jgi:pyruvate dehydrogenase E2 component (dihydrolipoamide acetyltransferase)
MAELVKMPQMGFDMIEGTIVRWLKREGDAVTTGEAIAEVETDKAIVELESPAEGILLAITAAEGALVPVGGVLAYVGVPGEDRPALGAAQPRASAPRVSPVAQRIASERRVDTANLIGTGPQGQVTKQDVLDAPGNTAPPAAGIRAGFPPRTPNAEGRIALGPMGEAIARRTQATIRDVPHIYFTITVDMTTALDFRREINRTHDGASRVSLNDIIIKAATLTLLKYPVFNATYVGDHLNVHPHVNIGVAIALSQGLMVPAILHCELKSLGEIAQGAKDLAHRATNGTLRQAEYSGTFTISNLGMFGVDSFTSIVVAPQVAVLSVSAVKPTPVVVNHEIIVRQIMSVTIGVDHRAANGAEAAQFLSGFKRLLEEPTLLGS